MIIVTTFKKHGINYSNSSKVISDADYIIVTVPTPINKKRSNYTKFI